jgi:hypothetical protein
MADDRDELIRPWSSGIRKTLNAEISKVFLQLMAAKNCKFPQKSNLATRRSRSRRML